ncbi:hypothetical protein [Azohydromonas lata]|uniref:hypothetical protein n=1 Tax=Azohydromonas lata TaxID=45677 RepID=UPI0012F509E2|nr:hypothetical protein [Azohydromonas lata]
MEPSTRKGIALFICDELLTLAFQVAACFLFYKISSGWIVSQLLENGGVAPSQTVLTLLALMAFGIWISLGIGSCLASLMMPVSHERR